MIGIAALVVGIVLGLLFHPSVPEVIQPYLPIAVVAALDAVFGGLRAYLERIFDPKAFWICSASVRRRLMRSPDERSLEKRED